MAIITYHDTAHTEHTQYLKDDTLQDILIEFGNVKNYLLSLGLHFVSCSHEFEK